MKKKMIFLSAIMLSVTLILVLAQPLIFHIYFVPKTFNSSLWKSEGSALGKYSHRQAMVDDLVKTVLIGKKWNHIEIMLGASLKTTLFKKPKPDMVYLLGRKRTLIPFSNEWLLIYLDNEGYYEESEIQFK